MSKWSSAQENEKINKAAVSEYKHHTKIRPSVKYKELHKEMLVVFQKARMALVKISKYLQGANWGPGSQSEETCSCEFP